MSIKRKRLPISPVLDTLAPVYHTGEDLCATQSADPVKWVSFPAHLVDTYRENFGSVADHFLASVHLLDWGQLNASWATMETIPGTADAQVLTHMIRQGVYDYKNMSRDDESRNLLVDEKEVQAYHDGVPMHRVDACSKSATSWKLKLNKLKINDFYANRRAFTILFVGHFDTAPSGTTACAVLGYTPPFLISGSRTTRTKKMEVFRESSLSRLEWIAEELGWSTDALQIRPVEEYVKQETVPLGQLNQKFIDHITEVAPVKGGERLVPDLRDPSPSAALMPVSPLPIDDGSVSPMLYSGLPMQPDTEDWLVIPDACDIPSSKNGDGRPAGLKPSSLRSGEFGGMLPPRSNASIVEHAPLSASMFDSNSSMQYGSNGSHNSMTYGLAPLPFPTPGNEFDQAFFTSFAAGSRPMNVIDGLSSYRASTHRLVPRAVTVEEHTAKVEPKFVRYFRVFSRRSHRR